MRHTFYLLIAITCLPMPVRACGAHAFGGFYLQTEPGSIDISFKILEYRDTHEVKQYPNFSLYTINKLSKHIKQRSLSNNIEFTIFEPLNAHYTLVKIVNGVPTFQPRNDLPKAYEAVVITEWDIIFALVTKSLDWHEATKVKKVVKVNAATKEQNSIATIFE